MAGGVPHQGKATREHTAIGEGREQLRGALKLRGPPVQNNADGAFATFGECGNAFVLPRNSYFIGFDIGGDAGAKPMRDTGITFAPSLDSPTQQMRMKPPGDARKANAMDLGVGTQPAAQARR